MFKQLSNTLLPKTINNVFPGKKIALWFFYFITGVTLWRSQHHIFANDGGAQSIATIPLDTYSVNAADTIVGIFALMGISQLLIGLIGLVACIRYRSLIPFLYLLTLLEYVFRASYLPIFKSIHTVETAPGAAVNLPLSLVLVVMLALSLWTKQK